MSGTIELAIILLFSTLRILSELYTEALYNRQEMFLIISQCDSSSLPSPPPIWITVTVPFPAERNKKEVIITLIYGEISNNT